MIGTFPLQLCALEEDGFQLVGKDFDFAWNVINSPISSLWTSFQCAKNFRLSAQQFDQGLETRFFNDETWRSSVAHYKNSYGQQVPIYHYIKKHTGDYIVVANTSHDLPESSSAIEKVGLGNLALKDAIMAILKDTIFTENNTHIFIPVAESRIYNSALGSHNRAHYVLLYINKLKTIINVNYYDSKSITNYNIDPLLKIFKELHEKYSYSGFNHYYLGHQGFLNNDDCGHYVMNYIEAFIQQGKLPHQLGANQINDAVKNTPVRTPQAIKPTGEKDSTILDF